MNSRRERTAKRRKRQVYDNNEQTQLNDKNKKEVEKFEKL